MGTKPNSRPEDDYSNLTIGTRSILIGRNVFDTSTAEGRMAVRAFAWTLAADGLDHLKDKLLRSVGKDDNAA